MDEIMGVLESGKHIAFFEGIPRIHAVAVNILASDHDSMFPAFKVFGRKPQVCGSFGVAHINGRLAGELFAFSDKGHPDP